MPNRKTKPLDNVEALQLLASSQTVFNIKPIIAFTMAKTGATFDQIGEVLGVSRQRAKIIVDTLEEKL